MFESDSTAMGGVCFLCNASGLAESIHPCAKCFQAFCHTHAILWDDQHFCFACAKNVGLCPDEDESTYWEDYFLKQSISENELSPSINLLSLEDASTKDRNYSFASPTILNAALRLSPGSPSNAQPLSLGKEPETPNEVLPTPNDDQAQRSILPLDPEAMLASHGEEYDYLQEQDEESEYFPKDEVIDISDEEVSFMLLVKRLFQICGGYIPLSVLALEVERKGLHRTEWATRMWLTSGMRMMSYMEVKGYISPRGQELCFKLSDLGVRVIKEYMNYLAVHPEIQVNSDLTQVKVPAGTARISFMISRKFRLASQRNSRRDGDSGHTLPRDTDQPPQ